VLRKTIPEDTDAAPQAVQHLKSLDGSFLKMEIACRIMLTVPFSVVLGQNFFEIENINFNIYLKTTMA
jgi:hypothetical protein